MKRFVICIMIFAFSVVFFEMPMIVEADSVGVCSDTVVDAEYAALIWIHLRDSGSLFVGDDGLFVVKSNDCEGLPGYETFLEVVNDCNGAISEGIVVTTSSNGVANACSSGNEINNVMEDINSYYTLESENGYNDGCSTLTIGSSFHYKFDDELGAHICSAQKVDVIAICEKNYKTITDYYDSMYTLQIVEPTFSAQLATISYWISKVQPGGEWDYKVSSTYGPYNKPLCSYYEGSNHHFTSEYFGNLNYGYTGSFLFTLDVLHFGSSAVSGFSAADEEDWPAIDEGFYLKRS